MNRFGNVDGGAVTPESQGEYLSKHGHLLGIIGESPNFIKVYTYEGFGYKVCYANDHVIQVIKIGEEEAKVYVACSNVKFGEF
jgi:hypothetical protein